MKYFVDAETREASGHEDYIEFHFPALLILISALLQFHSIHYNRQDS